MQNLVKAGDRFSYTYDFGDNWEHRITVESIESVDAMAPGDCNVLAGERSAPPEDVGGTSGYQDFLEEILSRPISEEGKNLLEWVGGHFDQEQFDIRTANAAIKRLLWNHWGGR